MNYHRKVVFGVILTVIALSVFILSAVFIAVQHGAYGLGAVPFLVSSVLATLSTLETIRLIKILKNGRGTGEQPKPDMKSRVTAFLSGSLFTSLMLCAMYLSLLLCGTNFYISSAVFVYLTMISAESGGYFKKLAITIILTAALYVVFKLVLNLDIFVL